MSVGNSSSRALQVWKQVWSAQARLTWCRSRRPISNLRHSKMSQSARSKSPTPSVSRQSRVVKWLSRIRLSAAQRCATNKIFSAWRSVVQAWPTRWWVTPPWRRLCALKSSFCRTASGLGALCLQLALTSPSVSLKLLSGVTCRLTVRNCLPPFGLN